jgi:hypothetical protein
MRHLISLCLLLTACGYGQPKSENIIDDCMDRRVSEFLQDNQLSQLSNEQFCQIGVQCSIETGHDFTTQYCPEPEVPSGTTDPA